MKNNNGYLILAIILAILLFIAALWGLSKYKIRFTEEITTGASTVTTTEPTKLTTTTVKATTEETTEETTKPTTTRQTTTLLETTTETTTEEIKKLTFPTITFEHLTTTKAYKMTPQEFRRAGVVYYNGYKFTYYSERVLPGPGLKIPGRHSDGNFVRDENNYICVASRDLPKGTVVDTPFGEGKVYDVCRDSGTIDVYVSW